MIPKRPHNILAAKSTLKSHMISLGFFFLLNQFVMEEHAISQVISRVMSQISQVISRVISQVISHVFELIQILL